MVRIGLDVPASTNSDVLQHNLIVRQPDRPIGARCLREHVIGAAEGTNHPERHAIKLAGYPPIALTLGLLQGGLIRSPDNNLLPFRDLQISMEQNDSGHFHRSRISECTFLACAVLC